MIYLHTQLFEKRRHAGNRESTTDCCWVNNPIVFYSRSHPSTFLTTATEADEHVKNKLILAEQTSAHWRTGHIWILRKIQFTYRNQGRAFIGLTRRTAKFRLNNRIFYTGISFGTRFCTYIICRGEKTCMQKCVIFRWWNDDVEDEVRRSVRLHCLAENFIDFY